MTLSLAFVLSPSIVSLTLLRTSGLDAIQAAMDMTKVAPQPWALHPTRITFMIPRGSLLSSCQPPRLVRATHKSRSQVVSEADKDCCASGGCVGAGGERH